MPVTDDLLKPFLEGMSIGKSIRKKQLFIIDYEILKDMPLRQGGEVRNILVGQSRVMLINFLNWGPLSFTNISKQVPLV